MLNINQKIVNLITVLITLIIIELISQGIVLKFEKKYSILLKTFLNNTEVVEIGAYQIKWDYNNHKMKPGKYQNKYTTYNINSKGFRGKEFDVEKNKVRILVFGGSTTLGLRSPDDKTYPAQLEDLLNQNNEDYEVINMGFISKSLKFIKNLYFLEAYKYNPDIIVIYSNRNTMMYDGSSIEPDFENSKLLQVNFFLQDNIMSYRLMWKIYKKILNYNLQGEYLKSPFQKRGISENFLLDGHKDSLKELIVFSEKKNIKVILVKQAYNFEPNIINELNSFSVNELIKKYKENFFVKKYKLTEEANFWVVLGTVLNKNLDKFSSYPNVRVVDPINELLNSKNNFTDYVHLSIRGNAALAQKIYKSIID